jgi:FtsP/CotA-like multicopper oxidase with cupredoxin domain
MRRVLKFVKIVMLFGCFASAWAQFPVCPPRPASGSPVLNPVDLFSEKGVLNVNLTLQNEQDPDGYMHYCYNYIYQGQEIEAPTLRLNPGDQLILNLTNNIQAPFSPAKMKGMPMRGMQMGVAHKAGGPSDPCDGGMMGPSATNVHFHGLNISPTCHQDEVIKTLIQSGDPPFQYNLQIPANDAPGLYWYHPHPHGYATTQLDGGASGALIIEGSNPLTDGLTEHVIIIRQLFQNPGLWLPQPYVLTVNFQQSNFPHTPYPIIKVQPGKKEFWRVLNATNQAFLVLQIKYGYSVEPLEVISLDGIPLQTPTNYTTINLPPAGRVEFIAPPLPGGTAGTFETEGFDTGPIGNPNYPQVLAKIEPASGLAASRQGSRPPAPSPAAPARFAGLRLQSPTATRSLYFSEETVGTNGPVHFMITVKGQRPHVFHMDDPPAITTHIGAVEDWTIENTTGEAHAFHIHQLHFLVMAINGMPVLNPDLQDTITIPNWSGSGPYPSVTLRMDFRDPNIAGTFVYHCHILDHEDGGMMAKIQVNRAN